MKAMESPEQPRSTALRKWGPLAAVVVVVAIVAGFLILGGGGDDDTTASGPSTTAEGTDLADVKLPDGVLPYSVAKARGEADSIDWGERCDATKGVLALPLTPPPECFKPYTGDNGGATSTGVTADTIKVVVYLPQANDPILSFIYRQIGNTDTPDQIFATYEKFNQLMAKYYETYGRKVELIRYNATGTIQDEVAATSDAETIARDIQPFMVLGGPALTEAFADTLASNKVMCVSCTPGQPNEWYVQRGPYVWDIQKNTDQNQQLAAEYIGKRVAGSKAEFGGDAVKDQQRKLGLIYLSATPQAEQLKEKFTAQLKDDYGVEFEEIASYTDPVALGAQAREILARMKSKGVTTVVFTGDPLAPQTLTQNATEQDYFPEWVMTGSALVDTTIFARTYDQAQWAHAFGPSNLFARTDTSVAGSGFLYRWFYGEDPPAAQTAADPAQPAVPVRRGAGRRAGPHAPDVPDDPVRRADLQEHRPGPPDQLGRARHLDRCRLHGPRRPDRGVVEPDGDGSGRARQAGHRHVGVRRRRQAVPAGRLAQGAAQGVHRGRCRGALHDPAGGDHPARIRAPAGELAAPASVVRAGQVRHPARATTPRTAVVADDLGVLGATLDGWTSGSRTSRARSPTRMTGRWPLGSRRTPTQRPGSRCSPRPHCWREGAAATAGVATARIPGDRLALTMPRASRSHPGRGRPRRPFRPRRIGSRS